MSEYVTVEAEPTGKPDEIEIITNQTLTRVGQEVYADHGVGSEGSPLAQTLFYAIPGILALTVAEHSLFVTRDPAFTWEEIIDDVRDALRDFFL
jgi:hypothetical protein